ncbi:Tetrapyrrole (Corrin-Porphyrin) methylase family protein [Fulvivirga imtechensis AK7]|uniref:Tetrapyrrole (Corrin-Porphyrin) methylase family protein n=1 Tax=Fulvivirga imtechensis AK7 TaxID=1237149 RepID=L8JTW4_9BACT|nr:SAM-dependent methyltransferase [Fulvivirga imtechensis]ELR70732.1 Tetrapyrrole (Corrin-Porphyrin) methylase family protein [Fulvivirga imtechensis AK7]
MQNGNLYLIPTVIAENQTDVIPEQVRHVVKHTEYFLVENLRTARRYVSSLKLGITIEDLHFDVLDKNTLPADLEKLMRPVFEGKNIGILSESGCPGIADPGSVAVKYAHAHRVRVIPLVGPSSIFLSLMASGFSGQSFVFHGYLPIEKRELEHIVKQIEVDSRKKSQTQIFIEAPYRNNNLLENLTRFCHPDTMLCVAKDISGQDEFIRSAKIREWKNTKVDLHKVPTVFLLYAGE